MEKVKAVLPLKRSWLVTRGISGLLTVAPLLIQVLLTQVCSLLENSSICNGKIFHLSFFWIVL